MQHQSKARRTPRLPFRVFRITRSDLGGWWQLSDNHSQIGGLFHDARAALAYVRMECDATWITIDGGSDSPSAIDRA